MASELAKKVYQLEWNQIDVIDAELQEVREVLAALQTHYSSNEPCWCPAGTETEPRTAACLRTSALWAKLQITESNQIQEREKSNA